MSSWFRNSERISSIPVDDRAIHYGDGLFETVAIRAGEPRLWPLHVQRLQQGCRRLNLPAPDAATLRAALAHAVENSGVDPTYALAKLIVSAGAGPRGYRRPATAGSEPLIGVFPATPLASDLYADGVSVVQCETRLGDQPLLAGLKTLNRLEQVLGRSEWQAPEIFEGLMVDSEDRVICGTMSNVFVIRKHSITTPDLSRCGVAGVMRRHVMDALQDAGIAVVEAPLPRQELLQADTVFLSNSQFGVLPVRQYDEHRFPGSKLFGDVAAILNSAGIVEPGQ